MEVKIYLERMNNQEAAATGGGYCHTLHEIHIDEGMDTHNRQETVVHEILEATMPWLAHDFIDMLSEAIVDGLEQV